jgi:hypothetical protein
VAGRERVPGAGVPTDDADRHPSDCAPIIALLLFITTEGGDA